MSASSRVVAVSRIIAAARRCGATAIQASSSGCYCSFDGARPCNPARNTFRKKAGHEHMAKSGRLKLLQHLRQIRADRVAWISVAARPLAGAIRGHVIREGENLFTATVPHQEISEPVSARMSAFRALDAQYVELADRSEKMIAPSGGMSVLFVLHRKLAPHVSKLFDQLIDFGRIQGQD
jgi:hypothetical protein